MQMQPGSGVLAGLPHGLPEAACAQEPHELVKVALTSVHCSNLPHLLAAGVVVFWVVVFGALHSLVRTHLLLESLL